MVLGQPPPSSVMAPHPSQLPQPLSAISHLRRPGSFPGSGDTTSVLSPRSSETNALGVNMAEYVLNGSPVGPRRHVVSQRPPFSYSVKLFETKRTHELKVYPHCSE